MTRKLLLFFNNTGKTFGISLAYLLTYDGDVSYVIVMPMIDSCESIRCLLLYFVILAMSSHLHIGRDRVELLLYVGPGRAR